MCPISVLGLNNNFYGSYSSNQVFFSELMSAFRNIGAVVYIADTIEQAEKILKTINIDFSISFSKYFYYVNSIPLYDKYKVLNYQWVSDNPLKMSTDIKSKWIKYIFIDEEYPYILNEKYANEPLFLPLGFLTENVLERKYKKEAILMPCKIRNICEIEEKINESSYEFEIKQFLDRYQDDESFIISLKKYFESENISDQYIRIAIFRLANEYTRIRKRLFAINSIKDFDLYVLGVDYNNITSNKNVHFLEPIDYCRVADIMNEYKYVLNVDPNYNACVHDRFIKAVSSGSLCLTNQNKIMKKTNPYTYSFSSKESIVQLISKVEQNHVDIYNSQLKYIEHFSWERSAERIIENYKRGIVVNGYSISN